ncbi:hypothetical protein EV382_1526 [Micromonospora violae]|uniref:Uncharacterized protein n=1 Tax=Micromonospora violae TaxID=1278207 RepID=A0A4Q7UCE0_9ACTN|nr:hypothetical protein [Micromonospora violae]RZT78344.1 hypothetical protein EV382_1526 [Micromonospora violae]
MHIFLRLWLLEANPPIQAREQAAAKDRLVAQAHRRAAEHLYDGSTR